MKRLIRNKQLIKLNDAARLQSLSIDPNTAINFIKNYDTSFNVDNIIKDSAADRYAYWGAVNDDGLYLMESYMYKGPNNTLRCAFVVVGIVNQQLTNNYDVIIKQIDSGRDIRSIAKNDGIVLNNGSRIYFKNEFTTIEEAIVIEEETLVENY